jgi:hypothetical protein
LWELGFPASDGFPERYADGAQICSAEVCVIFGLQIKIDGFDP